MPISQAWEFFGEANGCASELELRDQIAGSCWPRINMELLSMGMSHDFEVAIEEGSNCVRVGTAIFGERIKQG